MKDGILNINKPREMTSFDVVAILRKKLGVKKIGHLGTLDPMAEGVLPVAVGKAARVMDYLGADMKEYIAEFTFGMKSYTDDIWGKLISKEKDVVLSREKIDSCIKNFVGVINQIPPKYSALKVDGRKLYEYARAGHEVEIKSRRVYIESIDVVDYGCKRAEHENAVDEKYPFITLKILCSKGTYIRSIARDMGEMLGTGAVMSALLRTKSGAFKINDSLKLEDIRELEDVEIEKHIIGADYSLEAFPAAMLDDWEAHLFRNGVMLKPRQWSLIDPSLETAAYSENSSNLRKANSLEAFPIELPESYLRTYRVYDKMGFIGIGERTEDGGLKAEKILV